MLRRMVRRILEDLEGICCFQRPFFGFYLYFFCIHILHNPLSGEEYPSQIIRTSGQRFSLLIEMKESGAEQATRIIRDRFGEVRDEMLWLRLLPWKLTGFRDFPQYDANICKRDHEGIPR